MKMIFISTVLNITPASSWYLSLVCRTLRICYHHVDLVSASRALLSFFLFLIICLISRWQNYRLNREYHEDIQMVLRKKKKIWLDWSELSILNFLDSFISILSNSSHLLTALWRKLPNQKVSAWLWLKSIKKGAGQSFTHAAVNTDRSSDFFLFLLSNLDASPIHSLYPSLTYMLHFLCCILNSIYWAN